METRNRYSARPGMAWFGVARLGTAGPGVAGFGSARQDVTGQGKARLFLKRPRLRIHEKPRAGISTS